MIDCTNALDHRDFTLTNPATAESLAQALPGVNVVKAFNLAPDSAWRNPPANLGVPFCGDADLETVAELIKDVGGVPVPAGALSRAKLLEATAALAIGIWATGGDVRSTFVSVTDAVGDSLDAIRPARSA
ncbi:hypothetical protein GCM10009804_34150 [Kribbella hippodromi]|uniref:Uncharacterized protein n=1 Tax=Kribbella hippodromi TaxID=434347 RepID=A0ABP4P6C1_9ACTN